MEVSIEHAAFRRVGPAKKLFSQGVKCIGLLPNGDIVVGAGDGTISKLDIQTLGIKAFILLF